MLDERKHNICELVTCVNVSELRPVQNNIFKLLEV
jgi:hypothetical protein